MDLGCYYDALRRSCKNCWHTAWTRWHTMCGLANCCSCFCAREAPGYAVCDVRWSRLATTVQSFHSEALPMTISSGVGAALARAQSSLKDTGDTMCCRLAGRRETIVSNSFTQCRRKRHAGAQPWRDDGGMILPWHDWGPAAIHVARSRVRALGYPSLWDLCCQHVHGWMGDLRASLGNHAAESCAGVATAAPRPAPGSRP